MFQKLGLNPQNEISSKNVAAVIVTAKMKPFSRIGQKIDVTVSSIGDAKSLQGGTLLMAPLTGVDGNHYTLADVKGENGLLVMFICNHCPYVVHVKDALKNLAEDLQ